jgi:hypothetical protein
MPHTLQNNVRIEEVQVPGSSYPVGLGDEIDSRNRMALVTNLTNITYLAGSLSTFLF